MRTLSLVALPWVACFLLLTAIAPNHAVGQTTGTNPVGHMIYPADGQNPEQQKQDEQECYAWSSNRMNGWDPIAEYQKANQAVGGEVQRAKSAQGGAVRGAAGGALAGLAIGAIAGDARKGAAIGAVGGGLINGSRTRRQAKRAQANAQQTADQFSTALQQWDRGYVACMQGRGYSTS